MLSLILAAIPVLTSSASMGMADPAQSVRISSNGEFIADHYPVRALRAREEGKVGFRLVVESDGSLGSCDVTESSGSKSLDNETCELILRYARLTPVRNSDGRAVRAVQNGYINWKLPANAPKMASAAASKGPDPDRIICKRTAKTGSLISRTKQCMSARQWAEASRIARNQANDLIAQGHLEDEEALGGRACTTASGLPC